MDRVLGLIVDFIRAIGLTIKPVTQTQPSVLPAIWVEAGCLYYDPQRLRYPGDLLHEAGHLAVAPAVERPSLGGNIDRGAGEEMMAIAWSWAALTHLRIAPELVFHPAGYRGDGQAIVENFSAGRFFGVPLLQWAGMTHEPKLAEAAGGGPFPAMRTWLRD